MVEPRKAGRRYHRDQKGYQIGTPEGVPAAKLRQSAGTPAGVRVGLRPQPVVFARQAPSTTGYKLSSLRDARLGKLDKLHDHTPPPPVEHFMGLTAYKVFGGGGGGAFASI